ncbi:MAG: hypothetical protein ABFR75_02540 [Acidobacteriota bacterium]
MRIILSFLLVFYIFPSTIDGLRDVKTGDKIPLTGELSFINDLNKELLIIYLKSDEIKSITFLRQLSKSLTAKKQCQLIVVDSNPETDQRIQKIIEKIKVKTRRINDPERKIYEKLGVIVLPTLFFIKDDKTINSFLAGYRANLEMFFRSHLKSLLKGEKPEDVYKINDTKLKLRKVNKMLKQAFTLLIDKNIELAHKIYKKTLDLYKDNIEASFGVGFTLSKLGKPIEAEEFFRETDPDGSSKRLAFGLYLSLSLADPTEENLKKLHDLAVLEPHFFPAVFEAGLLLEKSGKKELSSAVFKHAYKALFRSYRRNK